MSSPLKPSTRRRRLAVLRGAGGKDEELTGQALWESLKAVGAGHAVKVDDDPFFLNAGPTAARVVREQIVKAVSA